MSKQLQVFQFTPDIRVCLSSAPVRLPDGHIPYAKVRVVPHWPRALSKISEIKQRCQKMSKISSYNIHVNHFCFCFLFGWSENQKVCFFVCTPSTGIQFTCCCVSCCLTLQYDAVGTWMSASFRYAEYVSWVGSLGHICAHNVKTMRLNVTKTLNASRGHSHIDYELIIRSHRMHVNARCKHGLWVVNYISFQLIFKGFEEVELRIV